MEEIWKPIVGYEGFYEVSNIGRVRSLERKDCLGRTVKERILKQTVTHDGYLIVGLYAGGKPKTLKVHRLVCEAFNDNRDEKPEVNHINEIKTDNRACNLEWCTRTGNNNHGTRNERAAKSIAKALSKPVGQYTRDGELVKIWPSTMEVQRQAGFSQGNISKAANGNRKTAYGFIWKYKNETMEEK